MAANEGKFEYVKVDSLDFWFDFLLRHKRYEVMLIVPIPEALDARKVNYSCHANRLHFFRCAVSISISF